MIANNRPVHFEIPANDPERVNAFYAGLFGWTFNRSGVEGPEYWFCVTGADGMGINGAVMKRQDPQQPTVNYIHVASIDDTVAKAASLGGTVALPKMAIGDMGFIAAVLDPEGNMFGLWETAPGQAQA
jgi:hypothetical protein